jgi:hypothetical protein
MDQIGGSEIGNELFDNGMSRIEPLKQMKMLISLAFLWNEVFMNLSVLAAFHETEDAMLCLVQIYKCETESRLS